MKTNPRLSQSVEDYLETMYCLGKDKGKIKVKDISNALDVKPPSVVEAVQKLSQMGLVSYQRYREIKLTQEGLQVAEGIMERHTVLEEFLNLLGVGVEVAGDDACAMEHVLSKPTICNLKSFAEFMEIYPKAKEFMESFHYYHQYGKLPEEE
ncbi:MAG TPA: metal-dependent transcriptional regulator [Methanobacteriaceae archaeon]|nr:metal-dependent transcriptional regulator [Methanobacteriaceae archaeon]